MNGRHLLSLLALALVLSACGDAWPVGSADAATPGPPRDWPTPWPPEVGQPYPDLTLIDGSGEERQLSELRGRVVLLEPIGMNCPACNAFAGGNRPRVGGFEGMSPQGGLPSIEEILAERAPGVDLADDGIVLVHLLLYDYQMQAPGAEDVRLWQEHFGVAERHGLVLAPSDDLRGHAAYNLIPGFQLIDRDFVLRYDAAGHRPTHNLWSDLVPAIPALLDG